MSFPGAVPGWARFDGPAGTLMVDTAIEAMTRAAADGANLGGSFAASETNSALVDRARATVASVFGAAPQQVVFGANMTTLTLAFSRAAARTLRPGDEIVCTQLDHDANVTPWVLAARDCGASVVMAEMDPSTGRLPASAVVACLSERTRWVAVTGASNLLGSIPDLASMISAAHRAGARVFVDAVHLAPHRRIDFAGLGCDVLVTSPYKWYGPHAGVLLLGDEVLEAVEPYKVRPAPHSGPRRFETGTPSIAAIAGVEAAALFLRSVADQEAELEVFGPLLDGLLSMPRVTVHGPHDLLDRTPTVLFNVAGVHPADAAAALGRAHVAVWPGDSYAVEAAAALGLAGTGVGVRAGVVQYTSADDVEQLLKAVDGLP